MSFAEIVLRLAFAVGGWLIFIGHALTIAALRHASCDPATASPIPGTAFFAVLSALALAGVGLGLPWRAGIRWLAMLGLVLAGFAAWRVAPAVASTTLGGEGLCGAVEAGALQAEDETDPMRPGTGASATDLERLWPVLQLGVFGAGALQALRFALPLRRGERAEPIRRRSGGT
ncbi:MAG: hypothetical protein R3E53_19530 [Myxococcota bacterium]